MVSGKIDDHRLACLEKAADVEESALALPVPQHEAALGVSGHRGILKSVIIKAALIGSRDRPDGPLALVVPAVSVRAVNCYRTIASLCKKCLHRPIAPVGIPDDNIMVTLDNVI